MEMNTYGGDYFAEVSATFHKFSDTFVFTGTYIFLDIFYLLTFIVSKQFY
jgi:hypothetical protein